ncbi:MAG TPA: FGGY-family carbohydrate kinase [Propionibacteriaceae bacterium]|nr:FGGY-family carbohydrate kinase [Propionibacteriaceae bacterium]
MSSEERSPAPHRVATDAASAIREGRTSLGIELGSTRIKAVLIGPDHQPLAVGTHDWENQFVNRLWTYSLESVWSGIQDCVASLAADVRSRHGVDLATVGSLGVSAMMHGYLAFAAEPGASDGRLLTPFRTWRNTTTGAAASELSARFGHNIPLRWSIAHLYQAILDGEEHVPEITFLTSLAGYVHWRLSGERVIGVGDASGVFPIDTTTGGYDERMLASFDDLVAGRSLPWRLSDLLPTVLTAGDVAGHLTEEGARLLDPTGTLRPGAPLCPPEGDAGTGMVATNSVAPRTGNVSAGTSIFAMVVLEHPLAASHPELDLVTTPAGDLVAMVHCNNGASELNAWAGLFGEFAAALGAPADPSTVFETLFRAALTGDSDAGGLLAYNFLSGEHNVGLEEGRPLVVRTPDSSLTLANFMRAQLFSMLGTLRLGMDVLAAENVRIDSLFGHGGFFKTRGVGQRILAGALDTAVSVGDLAAEGGAWGIAVLAAFTRDRAGAASLGDYLTGTVFAGARLETVQPDRGDVEGFDRFMERFTRGLAIERAAVDHS